MSPARRLSCVAGALALAALALWVATRLVWLEVVYRSGLRGDVAFAVRGADIRPELGGLALLALAGVAAVVATGGWARRVVGVLLVAAGVWAAWLSVSWWLGDDISWISHGPDVSGGSTISGPATPSGPGAPPADAVLAGPPVRTSAPLLAAAGGVLLVLAGALTVGWASAMTRLGARYAAPGTRARVRDRDSEWWSALDAGEDPTANRPPADPRDDS